MKHIKTYNQMIESIYTEEYIDKILDKGTLTDDDKLIMSEFTTGDKIIKKTN